MKICLIGPTYPFRGGIAHYTTLLARALCKRHEVKLFSFKRQYPKLVFPGRTDRDNSQSPLWFEPVTYLIDSLNPWTWVETARRVERLSPELLIFPWWASYWAPVFWTILACLKKPRRAEVIFLCHNAVDHEAHPLAKIAARAVLCKADRLVTHSEEVTNELHSILGEGVRIKTAFLPTFSEISSRTWEREEARKALGLEGDALLFFGFVRDYKGLGVLLDALPLALKRREATLLVVGEFWKGKEAYLRQIERNGISSRVRIVDAYIPNEEVGKYFAAADLVVQPYLSATGSAICQLAYGFDRPVIATRVGNLPEVIQDGVNGRLVEPGDARGLADAIVESLKPETKKLFSENAVKTKEKFSWERLANIIVERG